MLYNNINDIDEKKINKRIKDTIKKWGSQDNFFDDIPYSKQSFHKCVREKTIPPLSIMLEFAKKLDCDLGYLLCEYDEKRHIVADIKEATGLDPDAINIILNMKDRFLKLSIFNDILKDDCFLAIMDLLYMTDYHTQKAKELDVIINRIEEERDNAETMEERRKLEKRCREYIADLKLHNAKSEAYRYKLTVAFSRFLENRYHRLPDVNESQWKKSSEPHLRDFF